MADQRTAKEKVDKLDVSIITSPIDSAEKVLLADVHNRQGTVLSDRRNAAERHVARYEATLDKEFYPGSTEAGTDVDQPLNFANLTDVAPVVAVQPIAGFINTVQYIFAVCNGAFAANRQMTAILYDGVNFIPIYNSGIAALVGVEDGLIHPTEEFTAVATYAGTRNEFDIHNGTYLQFEAVGLVAGEEIALYTHMISRDAGGLRA